MNARGSRVVGYVRVSTVEQAESGAGLAAQRAAIEAEAERRGWVLVAVLQDAGVSGKSTKGRSGLEAALALIEAGGADALVAAKVDRLARSLIDFCGLMERAKAGGWSLVALDAGFDMATPQGRAMVQMLGVFAELERAMISQRTRDGLAAKKAAGVQLGRRSNVSERVMARVHRERAAGRSLAAIASGLNRDAIPTSQGGRCWHPSTVAHLLGRTA
ncbi:MAG TPA: recombinase family protein [Acidimicrobiales bacterium]|jgi:DNA invertase Pin-like site-specific DNA recombinase|nr:recombinase family protein [Acidimicrobiales bacterium]